MNGHPENKFPVLNFFNLSKSTHLNRWYLRKNVARPNRPAPLAAPFLNQLLRTCIASRLGIVIDYKCFKIMTDRKTVVSYVSFHVDSVKERLLFTITLWIALITIKPGIHQCDLVKVAWSHAISLSLLKSRTRMRQFFIPTLLSLFLASILYTPFIFACDFYYSLTGGFNHHSATNAHTFMSGQMYMHSVACEKIKHVWLMRFLFHAKRATSQAAARSTILCKKLLYFMHATKTYTVAKVCGGL